MLKRTAAAFVVFCLTFAPGCAKADPIRCPESIAVEQALTSKPEGWTASPNGLSPQLAGVTFYDGPVEEGASLVPDESAEPSTKDRFQSRWRLDPRSTRGFWVACEYTGTTIVLSKKLPAVSACRVSYDAKATIAGRPAVLEMSCD